MATCRAVSVQGAPEPSVAVVSRVYRGRARRSWPVAGKEPTAPRGQGAFAVQETMGYTQAQQMDQPYPKSTPDRKDLGE
jgi:hypothetical protein